MAAINMPPLPVPQQQFIERVAAHPSTPIPELLLPYQQYENELRKVFAQQPEHAAAKQCSIVPVYGGHEQHVKIRARDLALESDKVKESYIMPLKPAERKPNGTMAIAKSLQDFKTNLNLFTESSLVDMNWDNVVVAGSAVVTSLLAVPEEHAHSKRSLRRYYHEIVAPASDVDLFLYDLTEEQAVEKIKEIEKNVRDALLVETTSIRTKNTITIVSQYPVRHVQIVLRIYKSVTEILTGFDVDCSCGAYDGKQVWASPRALAAYMTQTNTLDLSRRSPSYENRLSKYRHRNFEVRFPELDRSRVDPTIYERSFSRTEGLARLLILEKLPKTSEREAYIDQRRRERGRPAADRSRMEQRLTRGNIKDKWEDEVAEWVDADEVSNYHTFTVPYGPKFHARKIEKLLYTKDLLLNAEWNRKDREVNLHRHPAFFGSVDDVIGDCCGDCPTPVTIEEEEAAEQESKIYVSGPVKFMKDDCGRQAIGSFNPLSPEQYTDMAYVGNTQLLCQAIVDQDLHYVQQWLSQEGNDPSTRDHTGRCPLHLAVTSSSLDIVQYLIDHGARLVARLVDGKTALHLACLRGDTQMVAALLKKSEANEEEEANKTDAKRKLRLAAKETHKTKDSSAPSAQDATFEMVDEADAESDVDVDAMTDGSMVNIQTPGTIDSEKLDVQDDDSPDFYDVNVLTWDTPTSPLHLAVLNGHLDVVQCLVEQFGANVLLPVVLPSPYGRGGPRSPLLTLTLATKLPLDKAKEMTRLLFKLGASCAQADSNRKTALECCVASAPDLLQTYLDADPTGAARALRNVTVQGSSYNPQVSSPLMTAISNEDTETALRLLSAGARADIPLEAYLKGVETATKNQFEEKVQQPVILAVEDDMPSLAATLVEQYGIDCNTMTNSSWRMVHNSYDRSQSGETLLDLVKKKVKQLREWKHEKSKRSAPHPLKDDSEYLGEFSEGSYQHWSATQQLELAKRTYNREWESYVRHVQSFADEDNGLEEKQAAIYDKLDQFRRLETLLEEKSAKTFKELHPEIEVREASRQPSYGRYDPFHREPFEVKFEFMTSDSAIGEVRERYVRLFNATWQGDVKAIKELTMLPWTNAKGEKRSPSRVHVLDSVRASPLSIAVLNGRLDVATLIMRIAEAQYAPPPPPNTRQYHIDNDVDSDNDDNENENDDDSVEAEVRVTSEVIDDQLTIEDIGMVSLFEKTNIKPETLIYSSKMGVNLVEDALRDENPRLLSFLLDLSEETATKIEGSHAPDRFVAQGDIKMRTALHYAKPHVIAELIKRTAVGVSIDDLAVEHKANDTTEKSKYYQGLNVHGKKRKDWAAAGRNSAGLDRPGPRTPPLLLAAYNGTLDNVQWFMSDAPLRCYKQFAETHQDDKRLQRLSQVPGGFEGMVKKFMDTRSQLALHCCAARRQTADSMEMLKYLVNTMPDAVEARSADGMTPLLLAYRTHNFEAVKILLEAGADQTARDKEGMNLLHHIIATAATFVVDLAHVRNLIETIDKRLIAGMCVQRCSRRPGSLTPFALLVAQHFVSNEIRVDMARLILEFSHGAELELLNGEGHTPLHVVARTEPTQIRHHHFKLASVITEHRAKLVAWENATGKSPLEMVEDKVLARKCSDPDHRLSERSRGHYRYGDLPSIANKKPQSFIKPTINAEKALEDLDTNLDSDVRVSTSQRVERLEKLLRAVQVKLDAEGQGRRRLVTLNEASEVARRLAAVQRQLVVERTEQEEHGHQHDVEQDSPDEVEGWLRDPRKCSGPLQ